MMDEEAVKAKIKELLLKREEIIGGLNQVNGAIDALTIVLNPQPPEAKPAE